VDDRTAGRDLGELRDLFRKIAGEFGDAQRGRAEALQAHAALLALWFARCDTAAASQALRRPMHDALVERYRTLIEANFRAHWPVRAYAAALNVTADHLSRRCRAVTGLSALELAQERLLLEARRMLAYTDAKVTEIAHRLGFEDAGYFSRVFTKHVGQSPLSYRESVADGRSAAPGR
jgi:AraC-like DNA-binding protein